MLRRLVMRRTHLVKQRTRLKNQVHGILSRNLVPTSPHADLFSGVGRRWLASQTLPADEWRSVDALVRQRTSTVTSSPLWSGTSPSKRSTTRVAGRAERR
jgi:hypothetical protein